MAVTKSDVFANDTTGMENKTVIVTTILVNITAYYCIPIAVSSASVWCEVAAETLFNARLHNQLHIFQHLNFI